MLPAGVEVEPAIVADRDEGGFKLVLELPPLRRDARLRLDRNLAEVGLEHEIDDTFGRGIAIFARALLGGSEEHTSALQSLMRISYAVFCLTKKMQSTTQPTINTCRTSQD